MLSLGRTTPAVGQVPAGAGLCRRNLGPLSLPWQSFSTHLSTLISVTLSLVLTVRIVTINHFLSAFGILPTVFNPHNHLSGSWHSIFQARKPRFKETFLQATNPGMAELASVLSYGSSPHVKLTLFLFLCLAMGR